MPPSPKEITTFLRYCIGSGHVGLVSLLGEVLQKSHRLCTLISYGTGPSTLRDEEMYPVLCFPLHSAWHPPSLPRVHHSAVRLPGELRVGEKREGRGLDENEDCLGGGPELGCSKVGWGREESGKKAILSGTWNRLPFLPTPFTIPMYSLVQRGYRVEVGGFAAVFSVWERTLIGDEWRCRRPARQKRKNGCLFFAGFFSGRLISLFPTVLCVRRMVRQCGLPSLKVPSRLVRLREGRLGMHWQDPDGGEESKQTEHGEANAW